MIFKILIRCYSRSFCCGTYSAGNISYSLVTDLDIVLVENLAEIVRLRKTFVSIKKKLLPVSVATFQL